MPDTACIGKQTRGPPTKCFVISSHYPQCTGDAGHSPCPVCAGPATTLNQRAHHSPICRIYGKPIEYVKVCSLYGAGFYYMPGTDICIKIGGYVRSNYYWNYGGGASATNTPFFGSPGFQQTRTAGEHEFLHRVRTIVSVDTRQQTDFGTLRTYLTIGHTADSFGGTAQALYANRAFIQFAGFTMGKATSYYDIYSVPAHSYHAHNASDTGDGGWNVLAYTFQFGNGVSATLSMEDQRRQIVTNASLGAGVAGSVNSAGTATTAFTNPFIVGALPTDSQDETRVPDLVGNLRIDQSWGSLQVMGALHDASSGYYGNTLTGASVRGHPDDKFGWAIGVGARIKTDFISPGDNFQFQVNYTEGAVRYASVTQFGAGSAALMGSGNSLGLGYVMDGIYGGLTDTDPTRSGVQLTQGWGVNASYDHVWNSKWKTSVYGGYLDISFNGTAQALISTATCNAVAGAPSATSGSLTGMSNCSPDWSMWWIGSRTQWNLTKDFYMGVDVLYTKLNTAFEGTATYTQLAGQARPSGAYRVEDQDNVSVSIRAHRDFLP
jgi:hypothetical protein